MLASAHLPLTSSKLPGSFTLRVFLGVSALDLVAEEGVTEGGPDVVGRGLRAGAPGPGRGFRTGLALSLMIILLGGPGEPPLDAAGLGKEIVADGAGE